MEGKGPLMDGGAPAGEAPRPARRAASGRARIAAVAVAAVVLVGALIACGRYLPGVYAWLSDASQVRAYGWRVVGLFFDRTHLERFGWLGNTRRLELIMLVVFLIPGTPKDFLTYFAGLTRMRFGAVLAITTLGRLPSIVTSTVAASAFGDGNYLAALAAVAVAAALIAVGGALYRAVEMRERPRRNG